MDEGQNERSIVRPILEETLPSQFIYDIGLYLQTCAHIEVSACRLICEVEGLGIDCDEFFPRFHELRKLSVSELIKELGRASQKLGGERGESIHALTSWVSNFKKNRDIAAHGAFFWEQEYHRIRVLYTHNVGSRSAPKYLNETSFLTREQILEHVYDADRILRTINGLRVSLSDEYKTSSRSAGFTHPD